MLSTGSRVFFVCHVYAVVSQSEKKEQYYKNAPAFGGVWFCYLYTIEDFNKF